MTKNVNKAPMKLLNLSLKENWPELSSEKKKSYYYSAESLWIQFKLLFPPITLAYLTLIQNSARGAFHPLKQIPCHCLRQLDFPVILFPM